MYMKSNYDRSKTVSRKPTKKYHPRADDLHLLKIGRLLALISMEALKRVPKAIDYLRIIVH